MKKIFKKLSVAALCLAAVFSLAVPAMALPSESYAVLNVRYAPNGTPINSTEGATVEYRAYKVANAVKNPDGYSYTLTEPFKNSGIAVNEAMGGMQLSNNSAAYRTLLNQFGTFINNSNGAIAPYTTAETKAVTVSGTPENGIAQLTGLEDGLYLVATRAVTTIGRTQYTAVPFLVNIPYETEDGVLNNYLTATVKFTTYTPSDPSSPDPENPTPPDNPNPPDEPTPPNEPLPDEPTPTVRPETPETPDTPDTPVIDISEDDVPLVDTPEDPEIEITDEKPPLERLPQTGLLWWPVPVMALTGVVFVVFGIITKRRNCQDA